MCGSKDGAPGRGDCCIFGIDVNDAAIVADDGIVLSCSEVFTIVF